MNLTTQKKLAAKILKVGVNRVWIDPEHMEEVSRAITRNSIKALINDGVIKAKPVNGISSYRAKKNAQQMIDNLKLEYNRARQSTITQEITEIVSGAGK